MTVISLIVLASRVTLVGVVAVIENSVAYLGSHEESLRVFIVYCQSLDHEEILRVVIVAGVGIMNSF
jgi:bisphosphoglycerate-dependent phosphoglycerate mutase